MVSYMYYSPPHNEIRGTLLNYKFVNLEHLEPVNSVEPAKDMQELVVMSLQTEPIRNVSQYTRIIKARNLGGKRFQLECFLVPLYHCLSVKDVLLIFFHNVKIHLDLMLQKKKFFKLLFLKIIVYSNVLMILRTSSKVVQEFGINRCIFNPS